MRPCLVIGALVKLLWLVILTAAFGLLALKLFIVYNAVCPTNTRATCAELKRQLLWQRALGHGLILA